MFSSIYIVKVLTLKLTIYILQKKKLNKQTVYNLRESLYQQTIIICKNFALTNFLNCNILA